MLFRSLMKKHITLVSICYLALLGFATGCDQKPAPLKEGVVWKVIWSPEKNSQTGFYREKLPATISTGQAGEYGVDMYGVLYPDCLEVRRVGSQDSRSQIIPFSQITWLEFGDGGVTISKP